MEGETVHPGVERVPTTRTPPILVREDPNGQATCTEIVQVDGDGGECGLGAYVDLEALNLSP